MEILKDFQEVCLDKLTVTHGKELEISANITSAKQLDLVMMGNVYGQNGLRSRYFETQKDSMLRLTCSFEGRCRTDIVEIGKSVKMPLLSTGTSPGGPL